MFRLVKRCQRKTQLFIKTDGNISYEWIRFNCANSIVLVPNLKASTLNVKSKVYKWYFCNWPNVTFFFFLSFNVLIGWQLSTCSCCKSLFSLLCYCQLLCFWQLALSIVVEVFLWPFSRYCSFKDVYYKLVMPNCFSYPWVASILYDF